MLKSPLSWAAIFTALLTIGGVVSSAGSMSSIALGFLHPVTGLDHVAVMVAVGVIAAQAGGRAVWIVPATFIAMLVMGFVVGAGGLPLPLVQAGIAVSVVALGLAIGFGWTPPASLAAAFVGLFAIFHGHAHGTEMPLGANAEAYGAGFVLATGLLHAVGVALGLAAPQRIGAPHFAMRLGGGVMALTGVLFGAGLF